MEAIKYSKVRANFADIIDCSTNLVSLKEPDMDKDFSQGCLVTGRTGQAEHACHLV